MVVVITPFIVLTASFIARRIFILLDEKFADIVSGAVLSSVVPVYNYLRKQEIRVGLSRVLQGIQGLENLTLKWPLVILYGTIVTTGIIQLYGGLMGLEVGFFSTESTFSSTLDVMGIIYGTLVLPLLYFLLGVWVGKRTDKLKPLVLIAILLLERTLNIVMTYLIIPNTIFVELYKMSKDQVFQNPFLWIFYGVIIFLGTVFGLLGVWRGHRVRMSGYIEEVFKVIPADIQRDIVALSYEEAQRAVAVRSPESTD